MLAALAYYIWWTSKGKLLLFSLRSVGPWFTDPTWSEHMPKDPLVSFLHMLIEGHVICVSVYGFSLGI
jgi:hypothetical protein